MSDTNIETCDNENNKETEILDNVDYVAERNKKMKENYKKNCDDLFDNIYKMVKNQSDQDVKFFIGPVDFTNGINEDNDNIKNIVSEMQIRSDARVAKNKKAAEFAAKSGKTINLGEFIEFNNLIVMFHYYNNDKLTIYIQNQNDLFNYIIKKYSDINNKDGFSTYDNKIISINSKLVKPMTERDNVHKYGFQYFISENIIKRSDSEEMIFGDDLIE